MSTWSTNLQHHHHLRFLAPHSHQLAGICIKKRRRKEGGGRGVPLFSSWPRCQIYVTPSLQIILHSLLICSLVSMQLNRRAHGVVCLFACLCLLLGPLHHTSQEPRRWKYESPKDKCPKSWSCGVICDRALDQMLFPWISIHARSSHMVK